MTIDWLAVERFGATCVMMLVAGLVLGGLGAIVLALVDGAIK